MLLNVCVCMEIQQCWELCTLKKKEEFTFRESALATSFSLSLSRFVTLSPAFANICVCLFWILTHIWNGSSAKKNLSKFRQCEGCFSFCSGFDSAQVLSAIRWHWNGSLLFVMFNFILYIWRWLHLPRSPFGFSVSHCIRKPQYHVPSLLLFAVISIENVYSINSKTKNHCLHMRRNQAGFLS